MVDVIKGEHFGFCHQHYLLLPKYRLQVEIGQLFPYLFQEKVEFVGIRWFVLL
ncbi:hypothetical protein SDC9_152456 [bioreactor metagenome]|uniref:Uncharacterized protein n=1 Tax=bioreactor metagenome TaxID=1076179 RepID=A0A645EUU8_9ZZZZ